MNYFLEFIKKHKVKLIVILLLTSMFFSMLFSSMGDSGIVDEIAHIPAGYTYWATGDFRINPEHPPLIKALSAAPLLFLKLKFPYQYWQAYGNNQWELGWKFIYHFGNNPDQMFFWSRLPIIFLALFLGYFVFKWARELYGTKAGIFALFLYSFSPNMIAHSRFVTTDLGMAVFYVLGIYFYGNFLKNPNKKNIIVAGIFFGLAQLAKYSGVLLGPTFIILAILKAYSEVKFVKKEDKPWILNYLSYLFNKEVFIKSLKLLTKTIFIFAIGVLLIVLVYWPFTFRMSNAVQDDLIRDSIPTNQNIQNILISISHFSKALGQYLLGLAMVFVHVEGGHTAYLLGSFSRVGWWYFFPIAFLVKTPIPTLIFLFLAIVLIRKFKWKFSEWLLIVPVIFYFLISVRGSLNIGVRHLLPIYPFIFIYVSKIAPGIQQLALNSVKFAKKWLFMSVYFLFAFLCVWYLWTSLSVYPHYVSYFNEAVGGPKNGHKYLVDSSLDWGQDLKRLAEYVEENNIKNIKIDYFGGGVPGYFIPDSIEWHSQNGKTTGWIAISATFLQMSKFYAPLENQESYEWIEKNYQPEVVIGHSIFVYNIPE